MIFIVPKQCKTDKKNTNKLTHSCEKLHWVILDVYLSLIHSLPSCPCLLGKLIHWSIAPMERLEAYIDPRAPRLLGQARAQHIFALIATALVQGIRKTINGGSNSKIQFNVKSGLSNIPLLINLLLPNFFLQFKNRWSPGLINRLARTWLINPLCWKPFFLFKILYKNYPRGLINPDLTWII